MLYEIGLRIREFREARGMTQRQLAREIGVNEAVISNWETGVSQS